MLALEGGAQQEAEVCGGAAEDRRRPSERLLPGFPALLQRRLQGHGHRRQRPQPPLSLLRLLRPRAGGAGGGDLGTEERRQLTPCARRPETGHRHLDSTLKMMCEQKAPRKGSGNDHHLPSLFLMLIFNLSVPAPEAVQVRQAGTETCANDNYISSVHGSRLERPTLMPRMHTWSSEKSRRHAREATTGARRARGTSRGGRFRAERQSPGAGEDGEHVPLHAFTNYLISLSSCVCYLFRMRF